MPSSIKAAGLSFLILFGLVGCSSDKLPGLVPAEGELIFNGAPLAGANISFIPVKAGGMPGSALTSPQGKFVLRTRDPNDGLFPGDYVVTVMKIEVLYMPTEEESETHFQKTGKSLEPKTKQIVPDLFGSKGTTPLKYAISPKGDRKILIQFDEKGPVPVP